ncbi:EaA protein [Salmonella phage 103203_sal4]|nr:hypothetical protein SPN9CC_0008 [Salmonella phage SPN9CC]YP_009274651.1 EaA protein [Salmonella phage 118970_sal4]YP_009325300.1 EaA protein [Salmonella phage 103203_sal5]ANM45134.1 EaA protein [Salmonella phage 146851_sal5]ANM45220.1 EaA protein [Salmonella phage 146851_sal4]ANM45372.1 EaA protein [Salmonella phage 103203_sal4]ANM45436.1 EaA protein [Salmonella phage 101962B_sal5]ANM45691.1 EaA protein [Salmonella phage 64795_sal4]ETC52804.1 hypothetical protein CFSAN004346_01750 [Salm
MKADIDGLTMNQLAERNAEHVAMRQSKSIGRRWYQG